MVTRKPLPINSSVPPYPDSGIPKTPFQSQNCGARATSGRAMSNETNSQDAWREDTSQHKDILPESSRPAKSWTETRGSDSLQSGTSSIGSMQYAQEPSNEWSDSMRNSTNPYSTIESHRPVASEASTNNPWAGSMKPQSKPLPKTRPPIPKVPALNHFEELSITDDTSNPWQPSIDTKSKPHTQAIPTIRHEDPSDNAWASAPPPSRPPPLMPVDSADSLISLADDESDQSPAWDEDDEQSRHTTPPSSDSLQTLEPVAHEHNAWGESEQETEPQEATLASERTIQQNVSRQGADGDDSMSNLPAQQNGIISGQSVEDIRPRLPQRPEEEPRPDLPPRRPTEASSSEFSRPLRDISNRSETSLGHRNLRQTKETYDIKMITWHDANTSSNPRTTPILVQNINGPCPLLALVNALTLSTPAELQTPLVEALRTREQISLLLLLDAVIDELMSGRCSDHDQELPDVIQLHHFLLDLHTGMNVNPRFFPASPTNTPVHQRQSMTPIYFGTQEDSLPGTFEDTSELRLYSAFSIPLLHGWLPSRESAAKAALMRSARSYEDVQNLQFREEELEVKLTSEGLSFEEQATLDDIATIKVFLKESATQLTLHGIDTIQDSMAPGSLSILFRNNHFITLYKHPETCQLFQLVTDMGYAGHDEVVWESLVDVSGENCEFFSGDFRVVGGESNMSAQPSNGEWTTVQRRRNQTQSTSSEQPVDASARGHQTPHYNPPPGHPPGSPNTEQEDHDLALALQLQEEEEERHRNEREQRRRETQLSEQYIEQQGSSAPPRLTPSPNAASIRGSGASRHGNGPSRGAAELRPSIPPRRTNLPQAADPEAGIDAPPPSYEQAANSTPYNPPPSHPAHSSASPNTPTSPRRQSSAYASNNQGYGNTSSSTRPMQSRSNTSGGRAGGLIDEAQNRRRTSQSQGLSQAEQDRRAQECVVM